MPDGLIGQAYIDILPVTAGFGPALDAETQAGLGRFKDESKLAGEEAGSNIRTGVKDGSKGLENDLGDAGVLGGANLRKGVTDETGKLGSDLEKDGAKAGEGLSKGASSGLSKLANLISNTGLPLGGLSAGLEKAGNAAKDADSKSSGLAGTLDKVGGVALLGVAAGAAVGAAGAIKLAESMQTADASIAGAEGVSTSFAKTVGDAFLSTAGKSEFSGEAMAKAFAEVAGQLKATEGHTLSATESLHLMSAASDLAEAKQINLGEATSSVAKTLQAFQLGADQSAHVTDVLYQASNATGQSIEGLSSQLTKVRSKLGETAGSIGSLSGLLVDMTDHGITGRAAMAGLNSGMNTLLKSADGVTTAAKAQNTAFEAMSPPLKALAKQYSEGGISSAAFKKQAGELAPQQASLAEAFAKGATAVQTAQLKQKELGVTVFDSTGKFVGMGSVIDQLYPRFARMTQQQQLTTAATLFGAGAARQMTAIIDAGPQAYDKATKSVEKQGTAQEAARKQSETLHGELKTLGATFTDLGTKIGQVLIPIVTKMVSAFANATTFILAHKAVLIALGVLIAGPLTAAIAVFTVNKMTAFSESFVKAGRTLGIFATEATTAAGEVEAAGTEMAAGAETAGAAATEAGTQMELFGADAEGAGAAAAAAAPEMDALGASFTALLGPIGLAVAALGAFVIAQEKVLSKGDQLENLLGGGQPGESEKEGETTLKQKQFGGTPSGPQVAGGVSGVSASGVEGEILKFWISKGFSPQAAAGFVGNAAQESSLNPNAPGGGLYQQSGYPSSYGTGSVAAQSEHVLNSLSPSLKAELNKAKSAAEAAHLIEMYYEKPAGSQPGESATTNNRPHREQAAEEAARHVSGGSTPLSTASGTTASETAKATKEQTAAQKAALAAEVKAEESAQREWVSKMLAEETKSSASGRAAIQQEVSERKAFTATEIAAEKAGESKSQAIKTAQAKQEATEQESGEKERTKLQTALTSGSLSTLNKELTAAHHGALGELESKLNATHKSALEKLSSELVKTWKEAEDKQAKLQAEAAAKVAEEAAAKALKAQEEQEKKTSDAITKAATIRSEEASDTVSAIQDKTKVELDREAEAGLTGTAEIAARLQTVLDEVTGEADAAIGAAKLAVDQAQGTGIVAEAQAASNLANIEASEKIKEAEAQAKEELAKGAEKASTSSSVEQHIEVTINGSTLTAAGVITELGYALKTGSLPTPVPVA